MIVNEYVWLYEYLAQLNGESWNWQAHPEKQKQRRYVVLAQVWTGNTQTRFMSYACNLGTFFGFFGVL